MRERQRARAGVESENVLGVRPIGFSAFDPKLIRADGVEEGLGFSAARERGADTALEGGC